MPRILPNLKPFYYLDHFLEIINFLESRLNNLLGPEEIDYIQDFASLSKPAQGLHVRLTNRRSKVFKTAELSYPEIPNPDLALQELLRKNFIRHPQPTDMSDVWESFKRPELIATLKLANPKLRGYSSLPKASLVSLCHSQCDPTPLLARKSHILKGRVETLDFLLFLFFGKRHDSLQSFALRDLGIVKTKSEQKNFHSKFPDRKTATSAFFYAVLAEKISTAEVEGLCKLTQEIPSWPEDPTSFHRNRQLARLGARLEKAQKTAEAVSVYQLCTSHPARERLCRILHQNKKIQSTKKLLQEIVANPYSDEELLFAEDFYQRKFGKHKTSRLTKMLREAQVIQIDEAHRDAPEHAALAHFKKTGHKAFRTENRVWNTLFGILFWDELQHETTHNEFEARPTHLINHSFGEDQATNIERKFNLLKSKDAPAFIQNTFEKFYGQPNGVFSRRQSDLKAIHTLLAHGHPSAIINILQHMIANPSEHRSGFPDLMVVDSSGLAFIEIKAEGDQIRRNQLARMLALKSAGFRVKVVRVEWHIDPMQEYVVVDVETTGGRAASNRITEIGAVKVRGNEIIETFSTLVNPERRIPAHITRITGIDNAMVASAPRFAEIAQDLQNFLGDAIFVAHNATFDYSFLKEEYARTGTRFRRASLCTVSTTRKFFPGLPSYSLANLTKHFGIPLETHHRALCDAVATAGILQKINIRRIQAQLNQPNLSSK